MREPTIFEGLIPVYGSGLQSAHHFSCGEWGWGLFYGTLAVTELFGAGVVVKYAGKGFSLVSRGAKFGGWLSGRYLANPAAGTFFRGIRARWLLRSRFGNLYRAAQRNVVARRLDKVAVLRKETGFQGAINYIHEAGSSTFGNGEIIIRQHAFYEPGGVKSVFLHEFAHSKLPIWASEFSVDVKAFEIAKEI